MNAHVLGRWLAPAVLWLLVVAALGIGVAARSEAVAAQGLQRDTATQNGITTDEAAEIAVIGGVAEATVAAWVLDVDMTPAATATIRAVPGTTSLWDVLVAATVAPPPDPAAIGPPPAAVQRFYVVTVDTAQMSVVGPPAQVPAPDLGGQEGTADGRLDDLPPDAAETIVGFLEGLLAGGQALDRYVTPDSSIVPITPSPYDQLTVEGVDVLESDGVDAIVSVHATGHVVGSRPHHLQYLLQLRQATRWEVVAIANHPNKDTAS